jgi:hypothetical protein
MFRGECADCPVDQTQHQRPQEQLLQQLQPVPQLLLIMRHSVRAPTTICAAAAAAPVQASAGAAKPGTTRGA